MLLYFMISTTPVQIKIGWLFQSQLCLHKLKKLRTEQKNQNPNWNLKYAQSTIYNCLILVPPSPLKKQPSKESVHSTASSSASAIGMPNVTADSVEEPIVATANKHGLVYRSPSVTSYAGEAKLGRIQLTVRYSVQRQKLVVTVHKIA